MEEIKLVTKQRVESLINPFNEVLNDVLQEKTYKFEKGKIYGIVGENGEGGEMISAIMSGIIPIKNESLYLDGVKKENVDMRDLGWYVGKPIYRNGLIKKELTVKNALNYVIRKYNLYNDINEVIKTFHLSPDRINHTLTEYSGEKWRASLAIGHASRKQIYCFSWMNTSCFSSVLLSSGVFRFFKKLKNEGSIIILPTSRKENVEGFVDEVIMLDNGENKSVISDNPYFIEYY